MNRQISSLASCRLGRSLQLESHGFLAESKVQIVQEFHRPRAKIYQ